MKLYGGVNGSVFSGDDIQRETAIKFENALNDLNLEPQVLLCLCMMATVSLCDEVKPSQDRLDFILNMAEFIRKPLAKTVAMYPYYEARGTQKFTKEFI